jgi:hypothetical protein
MSATALPQELGPRVLASREGSRVHTLSARPGTYVLELRGKLERATIIHALDAVYGHAGHQGPRRVIFWEADAIDYDGDLLRYYEDNPHKDAPLPEEVSVVTTNRMIRMVVGATAIGFRMFTHRRLRVYPDLPAALAEAQP